MFITKTLRAEGWDLAELLANLDATARAFFGTAEYRLPTEIQVFAFDSRNIVYADVKVTAEVPVPPVTSEAAPYVITVTQGDRVLLHARAIGEGSPVAVQIEEPEGRDRFREARRILAWYVTGIWNND